MSERATSEAVKKPAPLSNAKNELRCTCGRLLARVEDGVLELHCPRCKRRAYLDLVNLSADGQIARTVRFE
jgi:phage FluMu protein Com